MKELTLSSSEIVSLGQHPVETTGLPFESLGLSHPMLACIQRVGFKHPTPIQSAVIPIALLGEDMIGLAQTGSGKTAAFVFPIVERLTHGHGLRALILCPTREIALQTKAFLDLFGKHHHLNTVCLIGGVPLRPQIKDLSNKVDICVATPGRLFDHLQRKNVRLNLITELVLDEADHMLDLGFLPQITQILRHLPDSRHTMMFSATMPDSIERLANRFMKNPKRIDILPKGKAAERITHRLYLVDRINKRNCLTALLNQELGSTLVFTRTKMDADWLYFELKEAGHPVTKMHADRTQQQRVSALHGFREGKHRILVATEIAARGIDVPDIQHIVNFDVPDNVEQYIHRAGRTARASASGLVSSIATWQDKPIIRDIEEVLGESIPRCTVPGVPPFVEIKVTPQSSRRRGRR